MGYPRSHRVLAGFPGTYHCFSRCVRRAFLCGRDKRSGRNFEHRRDWLVKRLRDLANAYAADVLAFAVMHNHFHLVVHIEPALPFQWTDREVAERWLSVSRRRPKDRNEHQRRLQAILRDRQELHKLRTRLGSLSSFMAMLKEPIARRANLEDRCTGRFWEGRFKCQLLLDDIAVLGCMAYVDLNPMRAGLTAAALDVAHNSVTLRLQHHPCGQKLAPVFGPRSCVPPDLSENDYLALLRWTADRLAYGAALPLDTIGNPPTRAPPQLTTLGMTSDAWSLHVHGTLSQYRSAIGSPQALREAAQRLGQKWLCGITFATRVQDTH